MKYTFRLVPCSIYENEIMESWLEELALQGLVLENISFGIAKFRKEAPQRIRYCMSIIPAERWDVYEWIPGRSSFIDLCKTSGWNYICQRGQFGIFMTTDESVVEMHTEPELQYLDYKNYVDWRALIGRLMILMVALYVFWGAFLRYEFLTIWAQEEHLLSSLESKKRMQISSSGASGDYHHRYQTAGMPDIALSETEARWHNT